MDAAKKKALLPSWAVKTLIWCSPTLFFLLTELFLYGLAPEPISFFSFCPIPLFGLIITRLIFLHRSRCSLGAKAALTLLWALVLLFLFGVRAVLPRAEHRQSRIKAQERFEEQCSHLFFEHDVLPLELGSPKSLVCHSYTTFVIIYESQSSTLLCRYAAEDYEAAKAALETRYRFRTQPLNTRWPYGDKQVEQIEPYTRIGDDFFRVLLPEDGNTDPSSAFYKKCLLVVTNDVRHEIGYIVFEDFDLDMAEDLAEFLNDYCGWKHIRR